MLSDEEYETLLWALQVWADSAPDVPALGFIHSRAEREGLDSGLMTPRQVLEQVRERSPDGVTVLQALEFGVRRRGLREVVRILIRRAEPGPPVSTPLNEMV